MHKKQFNPDLNLKYSAYTQTMWNRRYKESIFKNTENIKKDPKKKDRYKNQECKICYYVIGRLGGAAITSTECTMCGTEMSFCNTCTDKYCIDCAKGFKLCRHCGGDIDDVNRRNREDNCETLL